ncbi:uncharacterized protein PHALS_00841 [Plasmopara halstedii]|uniref:Uncharacterized protein n=1 Tax=Plasmopara halstedii TaxID=4781 RepID=A0A0P1ATA6_PLAHL|nr:uncharacterized protein PHALS_00841 [Plasmopara halstedii]CEG44478.1 hypothetical protein PHALS_00841 [Plasmopara halstedii]|eukprot:XP_024580847.1 hypothetical protein PHALS_00841 [Plasmopara halstedii]
MTKARQQEMPRICENEVGLLSSGDNVATEGEEKEEDIASTHNPTTRDCESVDHSQSLSNDIEQLTPYVAKCFGHLETLRKRKRDQEEQVEALVEETFGHIEAIMQEIMRGLQERHAASHAQFVSTDYELTRSLRAHNRTEKKLKMVAAILLHEEGDLELE